MVRLHAGCPTNAATPLPGAARLNVNVDADPLLVPFNTIVVGRSSTVEPLAGSATGGLTGGTHDVEPMYLAVIFVSWFSLYDLISTLAKPLTRYATLLPVPRLESHTGTMMRLPINLSSAERTPELDTEPGLLDDPVADRQDMVLRIVRVHVTLIVTRRRQTPRQRRLAHITGPRQPTLMTRLRTVRDVIDHRSRTRRGNDRRLQRDRIHTTREATLRTVAAPPVARAVAGNTATELSVSTNPKNAVSHR